MPQLATVPGRGKLFDEGANKYSINWQSTQQQKQKMAN